MSPPKFFYFNHPLFRSKSGFTLVEMIVITGIIVLLATLALANYRQGEKQYLLQTCKQGVISSLRQGQNMALSSLEFEGEVPAGGYGLYFSQNSDNFFLFADKNDDKFYNGLGEKVEEINLPQNIIIFNLNPSPLHIVFTPPWPETFINGSKATEMATIVLKEIKKGETTTVSITNQGVIK
jgi:Tfp pilus assembly protein FimT